MEKARGTLVKAEKNLGYCTIKSPVKGIIIDRRVNVGQTVVSSLNAPSLFLIAKDLRRLQIWVSVNEADIGNIYPGQDVTFTVDSYPADVFHGNVGQIRLNATMTQNVVTYTVVVNVDNGRQQGSTRPRCRGAKKRTARRRRRRRQVASLSDGQCAVQGRRTQGRPPGAQRRAALPARRSR